MEEKFKILIVDDEVDILEFLSYNLKREGYLVYTASNGEDAIKQAKIYTPHLIILDIMMPKMDGIDTCRELRRLKSLEESIIIFLTARNEEFMHIQGLECGADDFIAKPIKPKILVSKVKAYLRRFKKNEEEKSEPLTFEHIIIDREKYVVTLDNKEIFLPRKEFELLELLASKPNKVFTRDEIFIKVWGQNVIVGDRTIDVHIRKIRMKLGIEVIKTVKGVGYKFMNI